MNKVDALSFATFHLSVVETNPVNQFHVNQIQMNLILSVNRVQMKWFLATESNLNYVEAEFMTRIQSQMILYSAIQMLLLCSFIHGIEPY